MFDWKAKKVYDWQNLFILLSLNKVDPFLPDLGFPLISQIGIIRNIAKSFVLALDSLKLYVLRDEPDPQPQPVFAETYRQLADALGEANTNLLLEWGSDLLIERQFENSVFEHQYLLFNLDQKPDLTPPSLPVEKLRWLLSEIKQARNASREIGLATDELDKLPRDTWEVEAFSIYNMHENNELELSPYDLLDNLTGFIRTHALIRKIEAYFTVEELISLENWCKEQPFWKRSESRPAG